MLSITRLLRDHPEGLTARQIGHALGIRASSVNSVTLAPRVRGELLFSQPNCHYPGLYTLPASMQPGRPAPDLSGHLGAAARVLRQLTNQTAEHLAAQGGYTLSTARQY
ncbi:MAG: hypothetical protein ACR2J4_08760, partial [Deinococcus sp.]